MVQPIGRRQRTVCSALWAAYGDALGFTTELVDADGLRKRIGRNGPVVSTMRWETRLGGRFGAVFQMPAGTYSDDTQLRLATCRGIRQDASFDVESFAKVELPIWLNYALGAGVGTKRAANNLSGGSVAWFSNFFKSRNASYVNSGGNGAAMRVQPHVWAARSIESRRTYAASVVRNAVTTHGHVRGIAGALVHADALASVFLNDNIPAPQDWKAFGAAIRTLPETVEEDNDLRTFWLPTWEAIAGESFPKACLTVATEWDELCDMASVLKRGSPEHYIDLVRFSGGLDPKTRGSGVLASLLSLAGSWSLSTMDVHDALAIIANVSGSDTDTIASMAGALLGALPRADLPVGAVQDAEYISVEANRLCDIAEALGADEFDYPDLLYWQPPKTAIDAVLCQGNTISLNGLGNVVPFGGQVATGSAEALLQWGRLPFGQTIIFKRRLSAGGDVKQIDGEAATGKPARGRREASATPDLFRGASGQVSAKLSASSDHRPSIDDLTDEVIRADFDPLTIGTNLLAIADRDDGVDMAIAFAAIVAKARRARLRKAARVKLP